VATGAGVTVGAAATGSEKLPSSPSMRTWSSSMAVTWPRPLTTWPGRTNSLRPSGATITAYATSPTTVPARRYPAAALGIVAAGVWVAAAVGVALGVAVAAGSGGAA
jgi:hypothetical protein